MKKPKPRPSDPDRRSDNKKRRIEPISPGDLQLLIQNACYGGSSKHKKAPHLYDLTPFLGQRGDESHCDGPAGFGVSDMATIPALITRGLMAGLVGQGADIFWTISDSGWIFEARITNKLQSQYHGYPVRPSESIAKIVYCHFARWVQSLQAGQQKTALEKVLKQCALLYKFQEEH